MYNWRQIISLFYDKVNPLVKLFHGAGARPNPQIGMVSIPKKVSGPREFQEFCGGEYVVVNFQLSPLIIFSSMDSKIDMADDGSDSNFNPFSFNFWKS